MFVTCSFAYTCAELLSVLKLYCLASSLLRAVVTTHTCNFRQNSDNLMIVIFHDDSLKGACKVILMWVLIFVNSSYWIIVFQDKFSSHDVHVDVRLINYKNQNWSSLKFTRSRARVSLKLGTNRNRILHALWKLSKYRDIYHLEDKKKLAQNGDYLDANNAIVKFICSENSKEEEYLGWL